MSFYAIFAGLTKTCETLHILPCDIGDFVKYNNKDMLIFTVFEVRL